MKKHLIFVMLLALMGGSFAQNQGTKEPTAMCRRTL